MEKKEEKKVCCICGKEYEGYGYNPFPVKEEGCCCQSCNYSVVVPERWERHKAYQRGEGPVPGRCTSAELSRIMTWMSARKPSAVPRRN